MRVFFDFGWWLGRLGARRHGDFGVIGVLRLGLVTLAFHDFQEQWDANNPTRS